jgi:hypothetical protein
MSYGTTYRHFRPRLRRLIKALKAELGGEDWEDNADDYGFRLMVGEGEATIDLSLLLEDAEEFEGDDGKGQGAFSFSIVRYGGQIISHFVPYNFTDDVWVSLKPSGWPELDRRLGYIENGVPDIVEMVKKILAEGPG